MSIQLISHRALPLHRANCSTHRYLIHLEGHTASFRLDMVGGCKHRPARLGPVRCCIRKHSTGGRTGGGVHGLACVPSHCGSPLSSARRRTQRIPPCMHAGSQLLHTNSLVLLQNQPFLAHYSRCCTGRGSRCAWCRRRRVAGVQCGTVGTVGYGCGRMQGARKRRRTCMLLHGARRARPLAWVS